MTLVSYELDDGVATVTMDDGKVNALSPAMFAELGAAFDAAIKDPALLEESTKGNRPVSYMEGAKQQQVIGEIYKASASLSPILKASVKEIQ